MNSSTWPESYDNFLDPSSSTRMNDPNLGHAAQHSLINDAVTNIEHFLGATPNFNIVSSTTAAGGDLGGFYPNPKVVGLEDIPFASATPTDGEYLSYKAATNRLVWKPNHYGIPYTKTGILSVSSGTLRFPIYEDVFIAGAIATVNTAPSGSPIILDVLKNGTSIYTTTNNRPTILDGANISQIPIPVPDINTATLGDYVQINILQIGSVVSGSDLSIVIITQ